MKTNDTMTRPTNSDPRTTAWTALILAVLGLILPIGMLMYLPLIVAWDQDVLLMAYAILVHVMIAVEYKAFAMARPLASSDGVALSALCFSCVSLFIACLTIILIMLNWKIA